MTLPPTTDDNGNGKVTLAVLSTKLDRVLFDVAEIRKCQSDDSKTIIAHGEQLKDHDGEITRLRNQTNIWSFVNSALASFATVLGLKQ